MNEKKVRVIYNGVTDKFRARVPEEEKTRVRDQYGLPDRFILHLGNTDPKKNTERVLEAYIRFLDSSEHKIPLVLADYPEVLVDLILATHGRSDVREHIYRLDYIVNKDLPAIYTTAEIFLYPSLRESFGIPLLEAMCCGTPVISSNVFAMPEVAGDAAYLIDPTNPDAIAEAIRELITNPELRNSFIEKGREQAKKFSWQKMANQVIELYKEVLTDTKT